MELNKQEEEMVIVPLKYRGDDIQLQLPLTQAITVLNDPNEAEQLLKQLFEDPESNHEGCEKAETAPEEKSQEIWKSKGKPTERDHEATLALLELRAKYAPQFEDKKSTNASIWKKIANELKERGFTLGPNGGEKCRQKFTNLLNKSYYPYLKHVHKTGTERKNEPPYFTEIHAILGWKHKFRPQALVDSETPSCSSWSDDTADDTDADGNQETSSQSIKNRFKSTVKTVRPKSNNEKVLQFMTDEREENRQQFQSLMHVIQEQNNQRQQVINILERLVSRKRKRRGSDSEDGDSD